jgi:hypothetical protein
MKVTKITSPSHLKVGDRFDFSCNGSGRGGHYRVGAIVTKVNRKTVAATEAERSYSPGTLWRVTIDEYNPAYIYDYENIAPIDAA